VSPKREPTLFLGAYELVRPIARGGMGAVFEVASRATGVHYAAKTILRAESEGARARFRREAELLARCDRHPGIAKVHAYGEDSDGAPCMILDLVRGEGLDRVIEKEGKLAPERAAAIGRDVARALSFVHARGIVHRDVKPSNVLLDADGSPRLTDFGLATARDMERLTRTGQFLGTMLYCSPEQARGIPEAVGPQSDVFSLGGTLFHALAGRPPIDETTPIHVMQVLLDTAPLPDVRARVPSVPAELAAVVARALEKDPARRYESAAALAEDLEAFLRGGPTRAGSESQSVARARRARRAARAAGAAVALAVLGALGTRVASTLRRSRALEECDESIGAARELVGHARASDAGAAKARDALEASRAHLARALALGAEDAGKARGEELDALARALAVDESAGLLARGDGAGALARLDAAPGSPAALPPGGKLARARALLAVSRPAEAAAESASLLASGPDALRAEAAETEGDALAASGDAARAALAYTSALEAGSVRAIEVRAKRAGAAALSSDSRTAFADLAALLPAREAAGLSGLPARLAPLAPALYLKALLARDPGEQGALLETAETLAPPPPSLRAPVADVWYALAAAEAPQIERLALGDGAKAVAVLRRILRRFGRALKLEPAMSTDAFWNALGWIDFWFHNVLHNVAVPRAGLVAFLEEVLTQDLPDQPFLLSLLAQTRPTDSTAEGRDSAVLLLRALHALPAPSPDENTQIHRCASDIVTRLGRFVGDDHALSATEIEGAMPALRAATERAATCDAWFALAILECQGRRFDAGRECLTRGAAFPRQSDWMKAREEDIFATDIIIMLNEGRVAEACDRAAKAYADHPGGRYGTVLARSLDVAHRYDDVCTIFGDVSKLDDTNTIVAVAEAAITTRREALLFQLVRRFERLGQPAEAEALRVRWQNGR
jgi:hypothetical protein